MTTAYWCVLAAAMMPFVFTLISKSTTPGYNNRRPRDFYVGLEGLSARANWAQQNCFEALPIFAAAVIITHQVGVASQATIDMLALAFIGLRVLYGIFYLVDKHVLRSLAWFAAYGCVIALFVVSA